MAMSNAVPLYLAEVETKHKPCKCGLPGCPAAIWSARFYMFVVYNIGDIRSICYWLGRN